MTLAARRPLAALLGALLLTVHACASAQLRRAPTAVEAGAAAATVGSSAPITDVAYELAFDAASARARTVRVAMTFAVASDAPVLLSIPAWTPGAYEITSFARGISKFTATDGAGGALRWDKADHDTWRVRPGLARQIRVAFDVLADSLDTAMAWSRPDFALFNGTSVFLHPEGRPFDFASTVSVRTEAGWLVATGMHALPDDDGAATAAASGSARGRGGHTRRFSASSYHDLVDMPFFVGRFDFDSVMVGGKPMRLATYPAGSVLGARRAAALSALEKMVPPQIAVFGEVPWEHYTVMQIADSAYGGASGLEHQNSHVDIVSAYALDSPFLLSLYAHEIFHAWNVKRLRPADLTPYRYDAPQPTAWLWVSEGVTDYYADLSLLRGGVIDAAGFYALTTGKLEEVSEAPAVALEDASLSTWVHPADGTGYLYYPKGSLAGLLLDIIVRDASDNRASLDDVLRELYATTYKQGGRGFTSEEWWAAVGRAAGGRSFADFEARYIDGREPFPMEAVLPLAGLRVRADTVREPRLGIASIADSVGIRVDEVEPAGAADAAGVRAGDYLVSVGDLPVQDDRFGARFRAKYGAVQPGTPFAIRVRRGGDTLTLAGKFAFSTRVTRMVVPDAAAGAKAVRIRNGILRGTVDR